MSVVRTFLFVFNSLAIDAALEYATTHRSQALLVSRGGETITAQFDSGFDDDTPHALYSGTKSFWGVAAIAARSDGLLELDEAVAKTIESWRGDPWKRRVTIRMLLSLTAGFGFGGLGANVPTYDRALAMPLKHEPGTRFTYGGIPLQVLGAVLARKLLPRKMTPHEYLGKRVLGAAGVRVARWRALADGTQPLPTGAYLTARSWLLYGQFVLRHREEFAESFRASPVNARYGLGWWLAPDAAPTGLFYASGSAGQALYLVPSLELAIVHFAQSRSYRHEAFLKRLFPAADAGRRSRRRTRHSAAQ